MTRRARASGSTARRVATTRRGTRALLGAVVLAVLMALLLLSAKRTPRAALAQQPPVPSAGVSAAAAVSKPVTRAAPTAPQKVTIGIYLHHLMQVDLRQNSFLADFYVWFKWKGDLDPTKSFELRNAVEQWQIVKVPTYMDDSGAAQPITLPDGTKYQVFRMEARFGKPFSVKSYPLDEQDLPIEIEDSRYVASELVYEMDAAATKIDRRIEIPGWVVAGTKAFADEAVFETTFGDPRATGGDRCARAQLQVHIVRPTRGMIVKTVVPLAIVILITFGVFFVEPHLIDARLALSVTALVSAVALEFSTSTELPEVGYLVLLDKVYILSYVVILCTVAASIFAARFAENEQVERAKRLDRWAGVALTVAFFGGTLAILLVR